MKLGLVLAGGGGKGGYEIGVWKYLKEINLDKKISVISGTSVGGLNAALMGASDYKTAEYIWTNEIYDKILDAESKRNKNAALFSRDGLIKIIDKYVNLSNIKQSGKQIFVTCYCLDNLTPEYINLNKYNVEAIKKYLCATSAIPGVFQNEAINGKIYVDGGVKDNVPLKPLLDEKCTHALIVNLDDKHQSYSGFDIKTVAVYPSTDLGSLTSGTMDFSQEGAKARLELGYKDCKNIYNFLIKSLLRG